MEEYYLKWAWNRKEYVNCERRCGRGEMGTREWELRKQNTIRIVKMRVRVERQEI